MCTVLLPPGDNPTAVNKYIKYKGKYVPVHAMKACRVSGCIISIILNLDTRWRLVSITQA